MEPKIQLVWSHKPHTGSYHTPDESNPHPIYLRSIFMLCAHLLLGLVWGQFAKGLWLKYGTKLSQISYVLYAQLIPRSLTTQ